MFYEYYPGNYLKNKGDISLRLGNNKKNVKSLHSVTENLIFKLFMYRISLLPPISSFQHLDIFQFINLILRLIQCQISIVLEQTVIVHY